jgi:molecular chaperone DnaJ
MNKAEALKILELDESAGEKEINKRFRTLAKEKHPDKGGDADEYKTLSEAYEYLKNPPPEQPPLQQEWGSSSFWPFGQTVPFRHIHVNTQPPPQPIATNIDLTFKEAVLGCTKKININRRVRCDDCGGVGENLLHDNCETCGGRGQVIRQSGQTGNIFVVAQTCPTCLGACKKSLKCGTCEGKGGIEKASELDVKLRGGLSNGNVVRLQGAGHYYNVMGSHAAGVVHINVKVDTVPNMRLHGRDVISSIDVSLLDALKGCTKKMQTIDGESDVKIQPGTKHKDQIRLRGFGVERNGDHLFNINVQYPKDTTPLIELLEKE